MLVSEVVGERRRAAEIEHDDADLTFGSALHEEVSGGADRRGSTEGDTGVTRCCVGDDSTGRYRILASVSVISLTSYRSCAADRSSATNLIITAGLPSKERSRRGKLFAGGLLGSCSVKLQQKCCIVPSW